MKLVKIFDDEDSVVIDDEYDVITWSIKKETKKLSFDVSVKNDCFYKHQTFEYKISNNPIELSIRLLEDSSEPPKKYSVKDGVVLESEILKDREGFLFEMDKNRIIDLKKSVDWNKVEILGNYEVNLYLLSKHPEIIPKEDYRKFLRQTIERIKVGNLKIEEIVKKDTHQLKILEGEYGKYIWYPESDSDKIEREKYWELSDNEKHSSEYGRKLHYIETLNESIFKDASQKYVGISEYEFRNSDELINYLEKVLDNKHLTTDVAKSGTSSVIHKTSNNKLKWLVIIILSVIALSLGVWTAIGIFILGAIIINLLSK